MSLKLVFIYALLESEIKHFESRPVVKAKLEKSLLSNTVILSSSGINFQNIKALFLNT